MPETQHNIALRWKYILLYLTYIKQTFIVIVCKYYLVYAKINCIANMTYFYSAGASYPLINKILKSVETYLYLFNKSQLSDL